MTRYLALIAMILCLATPAQAQEKPALYGVGDVISDEKETDTRVSVIYAVFSHKTKTAMLRVVSYSSTNQKTEYAVTVEGDNTYKIDVGRIGVVVNSSLIGYSKIYKTLVMELIVEGISPDGLMVAHRSYKQR